ncbi:response regulator [bacterium]|nr:response regulator [bacterium]
MAIAWSLAAAGMVFVVVHVSGLLHRNVARLENALRDAERNEQRLSFVIDAVGDGSFEFDFASQAYMHDAKFGVFVGDKAGARPVSLLNEFIHPDDVPASEANYRAAERGEISAWGSDVRIKDLSGGYRWVHLRLRVLPDERGRPKSLVGIAVDLSKWKRLEAELRAAKDEAEANNRTKSQFLANMSHEIRTPLNGVLGMAQALKTSPLTPLQDEMVSTIIESGRSLTALLGDVLDLSKVEAGKLEIVAEEADLVDVIMEVAALFRPKAEARGVRLNVTLPEEVPAALCFDALRVRQCVTNLVSNAVKFTEAGRIDVALTLEPAGDGRIRALVTVVDTGPGIDDETAGRLFRPFVQADAAMTRRQGGTGLGLAITRRLAILMGGDVTLRSAPGEGASFRLSFLCEVRAGVTPSAPVDVPPMRRPEDGLRGVRILLVDDNAVNRQVARLLLAQFGPVITEAENGEVALRRLEGAPFDVVLMDLHMPVMDGEEAVARIRVADAAWSRTPIIGVTADAMLGDRERVLAMGMDDYAAKPLHQMDLVNKIARLAAGAGGGIAAPRAISA